MGLQMDVKQLGSDLMDWQGEFEGHLRSQGLRENSILAARRDLAVFERWFEKTNGEALQPELITGVDLRAWRRHSLELENVRPATWNRRRATLRSLCAWARAVGYLSYDPFQDVAAAEQVALPPRWMVDWEYRAFTRAMEAGVNTAQSDFGKWQARRNQAMAGLMLWAGLREGEVAGLDGSDVVLGERSGKVVIRQGKGGKRREVPLGKEARRALALWQEVHPGQAGALFVNKRGLRVGVNAIQEAVAELARQARISVTPHGLRHTFAKRLVDQGTPLTVVADLLGHASIETTRAYARPGWGDLEKAVE